MAAARVEPEAFLALYDRYFDRVLGYVRARIRDEATCEDVASTVFTTALGQLRRFRVDGSFAGWLFARNAVRDVHRRPSTVSLPVEPEASERRVAVPNRYRGRSSQPNDAGMDVAEILKSLPPQVVNVYVPEEAAPNVRIDTSEIANALKAPRVKRRIVKDDQGRPTEIRERPADVSS